jgi:TctA family transporter
MNERTIPPLLPRREYFARIARSVALGASVIAVCLCIGMVGYHTLEDLSWIDAFLNAAMILSGMGPVATLHTNAGKLFAGCYALFSGLALISIMGIIMAPIVLRFLHKFHLDLNAREERSQKR